MIDTLKGLKEYLQKGKRVECKMFNKVTKNEVNSNITGIRKVVKKQTNKIMFRNMNNNKDSWFKIPKRDNIKFTNNYFTIDVFFPDNCELRYYYLD